VRGGEDKREKRERIISFLFFSFFFFLLFFVLHLLLGLMVHLLLENPKPTPYSSTVSAELESDCIIKTKRSEGT